MREDREENLLRTNAARFLDVDRISSFFFRRFAAGRNDNIAIRQKIGRPYVQGRPGSGANF
jgi:hypothetical protein